MHRLSSPEPRSKRSPGPSSRRRLRRSSFRSRSLFRWRSCPHRRLLPLLRSRRGRTAAHTAPSSAPTDRHPGADQAQVPTSASLRDRCSGAHRRTRRVLHDAQNRPRRQRPRPRTPSLLHRLRPHRSCAVPLTTTTTTGTAARTTGIDPTAACRSAETPRPRTCRTRAAHARSSRLASANADRRAARPTPLPRSKRHRAASGLPPVQEAPRPAPTVTATQRRAPRL